MTHKTRETLPEGFRYADRLQVESFMATGSVPGASKVCLVAGAGELPRLATRLRPPNDWNDTERDGYKRGWEAGRELTGDDPWESFEWEHGYRDAAENRMKWHLAHCRNHGDHEGGCGA